MCFAPGTESRGISFVFASLAGLRFVRSGKLASIGFLGSDAYTREAECLVVLVGGKFYPLRSLNAVCSS